MDDADFEQFYARTAPGLRAYLRHLLRDPARADDVFQETYLRFINAHPTVDMDSAHRKNYLYRIATNLARDDFRSRRLEDLPEHDLLPAPRVDLAQAYDVREALAGMKPKERMLLWLAYVQGFSHEEIARVARARPASIRPMLARARAKLSGLLSRRGYRGSDGGR